MIGLIRLATEVREFLAKIPAFYRPLQLAAPHAVALCRQSTIKVFLVKKSEKHLGKLEWNSFLCFTVNEENCREPAKQQRKGKNRMRQKLKLCFLSELICLLFIFKLAFLLKFIHFKLCIQNKQLRLLVVLGLPHVLTLIIFLTNVLTINRLILSMGQRAFYFRGPKEWNGLPDNIRNTKDIDSFKQRLFNRIFHTK